MTVKSQQAEVPIQVFVADASGHVAPAAHTDYVEFECLPHLHMVAPDGKEVTAPIDRWTDSLLDAERVELLDIVLPAMAYDRAQARREIPQLHRENARLKQRLT